MNRQTDNQRNLVVRTENTTDHTPGKHSSRRVRVNTTSSTRLIKEKRDHQEKLAQKQSKPFWFSKLIVNYPWLVLLIVVAIIAACVAAIAITNSFSIKGETSRTYLVWSNERVMKFDMTTVAQQSIHQSLYQGSSTPYSTQWEPWLAMFIYEAKNGNIFKPTLLKRIKDFQAALAQREDFQTYCAINNLNASITCDPQTYINSFTSTLFMDVDLDSPSQVESRVNLIASNSTLKSLFGNELTAESQASTFARSIVTFAGPIAGFSDLTVDSLSQDQIFISFLRDLDAFAQSNSDGDMEILVMSRLLVPDEVKYVAFGDMPLIAGSAIFVFIYLAIHLRSFPLALYGMVQTGLAFPLSYFLYNMIFRITYFASIHLVTIFIILGVAADDYFVFNDTWRQTAKFQSTRDDIHLRMALATRRASKAMFVTSFTTASAFIATSFSEVMPVSAFGYFSATLILANYFLVILMFPSVLALRQKIIQSQCYQRRCKKSKCCFRKKRPEQKRPQEQQNQPQQQAPGDLIRVQEVLVVAQTEEKVQSCGPLGVIREVPPIPEEEKISELNSVSEGGENLQIQGFYCEQSKESLKIGATEQNFEEQDEVYGKAFDTFHAAMKNINSQGCVERFFYK